MSDQDIVEVEEVQEPEVPELTLTFGHVSVTVRGFNRPVEAINALRQAATGDNIVSVADHFGWDL